jgi:hypothetical protein
MSHRISPLVVAALLGASCGGTDATPNLTQPTQFSGPPSVAVSTTSQMVVAERVNNPFCHADEATPGARADERTAAGLAEVERKTRKH